MKSYIPDNYIKKEKTVLKTTQEQLLRDMKLN